MKNFLQLKLDMEAGIDGMLANETKKICFYSKEVLNNYKGVSIEAPLDSSLALNFGWDITTPMEEGIMRTIKYIEG